MNYLLFVYYNDTVKNTEEKTNEIGLQVADMMSSKEIKFMLDYRFGLGTYDEMLGMRRQIRKEREETVYRAMEAKRQIQSNIAIATLCFAIIGTLGGGAYLLVLVLQ